MRLGRVIAAITLVAVSIVGFVGLKNAEAADHYVFDKAHTSISAFYDHLGMSRQSLRFREFDGKIFLDPKKPEETKATITLKSKSVTSLLDGFDKKLRGKDYFNVEKHPEITFVSKSAKRTGEKTGQLMGDLTINGITKPVTFDITLRFVGEHPLGGMLKKYKGYVAAGFSAKARVIRSEFGMGGFAPLVSDAVDIVVETELLKKP